LYGRPGTIGDDHDSTGSERGRTDGVDGKNVDHAGNGFGLGGVEGLQFSAKNWAARDYGILHARNTRIDAKFRGAIDLLSSFIPADVVAHDGEIGGILERNGFEIGDREFSCGFGEFAVGKEILARAVKNSAVLGDTGVGGSRSSVARPQ
jgi:hypothetical protein